MMILDILAGAGGQGRIEEAPAAAAGGGEEEHGQARLPEGTEGKLQHQIGWEDLPAPDDIIGALTGGRVLRVFKAEAALREGYVCAAFEGEVLEVLRGGQGVFVDEFSLEGLQIGHVIHSFHGYFGSIP